MKSDWPTHDPRRSVALTLLDAYRWSDESDLAEGGRKAFEDGLMMLVKNDPISEQDEETLLTRLLELGWEICPLVRDGDWLGFEVPPSE